MFLIRTGREQCNRGGVDKFSREIIIIVERKEGRKEELSRRPSRGGHRPVIKLRCTVRRLIARDISRFASNVY